MPGFYVKRKTGLKWVKKLIFNSCCIHEKIKKRDFGLSLNIGKLFNQFEENLKNERED